MQLSTYAGDFRAFKALITAQIAGVQVAVTEVDPAAQSDPNTVPVLTTAHGTISQSNAIARYIARSRPEAGLYGQSFFQSGEVDQWIDWGTNNVELPAILSTYWQFGWQAFNFQANKKAIEDLTAAFKTLEAHLLSRTFLVGQRLTLADIVVASQLVYPLKLSLDAAFRAPFPATLRWFSHVTSLPAAAAVVGAIVLCKTAPSAPKGGGAKAEKAEKPKAEKKPKKEKAPKAPKEEEEAAPADADEDTGPTANELLEEQAAAEAAAEAKKENPLDKLPKSSFVLDEWKRQYSNSTSDYFKSMNWFWPEFEKVRACVRGGAGWRAWCRGRGGGLPDRHRALCV
jgi:elongation factor 1-gamma